MGVPAWVVAEQVAHGDKSERLLQCGRGATADHTPEPGVEEYRPRRGVAFDDGGDVR
jgi:hypothetical protein